MARNARWYVYELVDPRDGLAFYVGKGCGNRIFAHEKDAERDGVCSEKVNKIKDIWADGLQVEKRHVAFFWDEQAAYDFEAVRVDEYGLDSLTNIIPGGGSVRSGSFIQRAKPVKPMTIVEVVRALTQKENVLSWFAAWLRAKTQGNELEVVSGDKWSVAIATASLKSIFPPIWDRIQADHSALEAVKPHLARYGIEIQYGSA